MTVTATIDFSEIASLRKLTKWTTHYTTYHFAKRYICFLKAHNPMLKYDLLSWIRLP